MNELRGEAAPILTGLPSRNHTVMRVQKLTFQKQAWLEKRVHGKEQTVEVNLGMSRIVLGALEMPKQKH